MKKIILTLLLFVVNINQFIAQEIDSLAMYYEQVENSMKYQTGKIDFSLQNATLSIPNGYKFLDAEQTQFVLTDLWGNMEDTTVLGAILPEDVKITDDNCWMFVISYNDAGYVNDDDANDIDYDDLLKELKQDVDTENKQRLELGYNKVELVGWASKPFYDEKAKVLHWAKEIKFEGNENNTLNYDLRVLGRKGLFNLSAVAGIDQLGIVKKSIPSIITSVNFNEGARYEDFDSSTDSVAAWTIGGLVAGKVLAKTGFFALIAKFGKVIILGLLGLVGTFRKFLFGNKDQKVSKKDETVALEENTEEKDSL